jgi:hypothetical protein
MALVIRIESIQKQLDFFTVEKYRDDIKIFNFALIIKKIMLMYCFTEKYSC